MYRLYRRMADQPDLPMSAYRSKPNSIRTCTVEPRETLFEQDGTGIDLQAKQRVGPLAQIPAFVKLRLAMQLIDSEVEIAVGCDGERVRPQNPRIVGDRLPLAIHLALTN